MTGDKEGLISILIASTRRKIRPYDLIFIADTIIKLKSLTGSLKKIAELIDISESMLLQFLRVYHLSEYTKQLVKTRKIDSVAAVRYLSSFNEIDQNKIAKEFILGNIDTHDIRTLSPLRKHNPQSNIQKLLHTVIKSKNKKEYVFYFEKNKKIEYNKIKSILIKILGSKEIIDLKFKSNIFTLKITNKGLKKLRSFAKEKNQTLKMYFKSLVNNI